VNLVHQLWPGNLQDVYLGKYSKNTKFEALETLKLALPGIDLNFQILPKTGSVDDVLAAKFIIIVFFWLLIAKWASKQFF